MERIYAYDVYASTSDIGSVVGDYMWLSSGGLEGMAYIEVIAK
jgi:hypothetical protein